MGVRIVGVELPETRSVSKGRPGGIDHRGELLFDRGVAEQRFEESDFEIGMDDQQDPRVARPWMFGQPLRYPLSTQSGLVEGLVRRVLVPSRLIDCRIDPPGRVQRFDLRSG